MEIEHSARHLRNLYTGGNIAEVVSEETKELHRWHRVRLYIQCLYCEENLVFTHEGISSGNLD
jgi:hypothetical protein